MQEVSRRAARDIFGSTVKVYAQPEFVRHIGLGKGKTTFNNWVEMYQRQTEFGERGVIKIVEKLGAKDEFNAKSSMEYTLSVLADANLHDERGHLLADEMKRYLSGHFDDWKSENGGWFKSLKGQYPTGQSVVDNIDVEIDLPKDIITIPDEDFIMGIGSYLRKEENGENKFYKITGLTVATHNPDKIDILYSLKPQVKLHGQYRDSPMHLEKSVLASDLEKSYEVQFKVPYAKPQKETKAHALGNLVLA